MSVYPPEVGKKINLNIEYIQHVRMKFHRGKSNHFLSHCPRYLVEYEEATDMHFNIVRLRNISQCGLFMEANRNTEWLAKDH